MISPLALYGDIGLGVFAALMLYRIAGVALGAFDKLIPDVSEAPWPFYGRPTRLEAMLILAAVSVIAWPFVVFVFFSASRRP